MKKLLIAILVLAWMMNGGGVQAADVIVGAKSGVLMSSEFQGSLAYGFRAEMPDFGGLINGATVSSTTFYSDNHTLGEIYAEAIMVEGRKSLIWGIDVILGTGAWHFMKTGEEDNTYPAYRVGIGGQIGSVKIDAFGDVLWDQTGPDRFFVGGGLSF